MKKLLGMFLAVRSLGRARGCPISSFTLQAYLLLAPTHSFWSASLRPPALPDSGLPQGPNVSSTTTENRRIDRVVEAGVEQLYFDVRDRSQQMPTPNNHYRYTEKM